MVAQLKRAALAVLALGLLGCQGGGDASEDKAMNTPSAANGPSMDQWAQQNPNNGSPGHGEEK